jgi:hypothetical protein
MLAGLPVGADAVGELAGLVRAADADDLPAGSSAPSPKR